jgi:hypothetical protein
MLGKMRARCFDRLLHAMPIGPSQKCCTANGKLAFGQKRTLSIGDQPEAYPIGRVTG